MQWFKMYGGEFLKDPKILSLTAVERICWVALLCFACDNNDDGEVPYITEETVMRAAGLLPDTPLWTETVGIFDKFQERGMVTLGNANVTIQNWKKRQGLPMSSAQRVAKHRAKSNETRLSSNSLSNSISYLSSIPKEDVEEWTKRFIATEKEIKGKAEDLKLYCERKGRKYKNYRSFLLGALRRDFKERSDEETKYKGL